MARNRRTILIAGGGIAGLTAALSLARRGFRAVVLERNKTPPVQGAGIQLSPNATHIFGRLGLGSLLQQSSQTPEHIRIHDGRNGALIRKVLVNGLGKIKDGSPYLVLHRADLQALLRSACEDHHDVSLRDDHEVLDVACHANGVTVLVRNQLGLEELPALCLIGADGVGSRVRKLLSGEHEPVFTGSIAWRALLPPDNLPDQFASADTGLWLGPNAHLVHYQIRSGTLLNVVAVTPWPGDQPPKRNWLADIGAEHRESVFNDWASDLSPLINHSHKWGGWPVFAAKKPFWREPEDGAVCLIGDAAHPMLPFAAQGGGTAIEDAYALARALEHANGNCVQAFESFQKDRTGRVKAILKLAKSNGEIYHADGIARHIIQLGMKTLPASILNKRQYWLYDWRMR